MRRRRGDGDGRPGLSSDAAGQQFVLEAVVVAIVLVSTIVLVTEMQPGQPGLSQPRTHDRLRSTAQDTLNNLAAQDVPACHEDLPACMQGNKLSLEVYQAAVNGDDALCRQLKSGFPEGVRLDVTVNTPISQRRVCGEAPPDNEGVASESANQPITLAFNYVHLFTDMDVYNGQDEAALDVDIGTEDEVASVEKRADQRVWAAPIWKSRPVAPGGAALEATVEIEGEDAILSGGESLIGEREFVSAM